MRISKFCKNLRFLRKLVCLRANCTNHVLSSVQRQCEPTSVLAQNSKCNSVPMEEPSTLQYLLRATSSCLIISNVAPFYDSTSWGVSATKTRQSKVRQNLCEHFGTPRPWRQSLRGRPGKNKTKQGEAEPL